MQVLMQSATQTAVSNGRLWAGRFISALVVLFLLFDGAIKVMKLVPAVGGNRAARISSEACCW
jgi:hypothetical protein